MIFRKYVLNISFSQDIHLLFLSISSQCIHFQLQMLVKEGPPGTKNIMETLLYPNVLQRFRTKGVTFVEDYFELKAIKTLWVQEKILPLPEILNINWGLFFRREPLSKTDFYLLALSVWQGKQLTVLTVLCPWEPQASIPFLSSFVRSQSLSHVSLFITPWTQPTRLLEPRDFLARILQY